MSRDATRFLFTFNLGYVDGAPTPAQLGLMELNPASLGQAPALADPKIAPSYVVIGDSKTSISVRSNTANAPIRTNSVAFRNGIEVNTNIINQVVLFDDGSHGDAAAGDGRFTNNAVGAIASAPLGPHTVRVKTEVRGSTAGATPPHSTWRSRRRHNRAAGHGNLHADADADASDTDADQHPYAHADVHADYRNPDIHPNPHAYSRPP